MTSSLLKYQVAMEKWNCPLQCHGFLNGVIIVNRDLRSSAGVMTG